MYSKPLNLKILTAMATWPGYALFFMMLFVPLSYKNIKIALLGIGDSYDNYPCISAWEVVITSVYIIMDHVYNVMWFSIFFCWDYQ